MQRPGDSDGEKLLNSDPATPGGQALWMMIYGELPVRVTDELIDELVKSKKWTRQEIDELLATMPGALYMRSRNSFVSPEIRGAGLFANLE